MLFLSKILNRIVNENVGILEVDFEQVSNMFEQILNFFFLIISSLLGRSWQHNSVGKANLS